MRQKTTKESESEDTFALCSCFTCASFCLFDSKRVLSYYILSQTRLLSSFSVANLPISHQKEVQFNFDSHYLAHLKSQYSHSIAVVLENH